ncbi:hypothetical protein ACG94X_14065 [Acinetobacter sp. ULE_I010]|uniref:hypothetical protein n=1 Tax=Acinetobacter sp. ULE_I010 TaxID=3373065 RepID=UPI003AF901EA
MSLIPLDTRVALAAQAPQIDFNQLTRNTLDLYDNVKQRGQQGTLSRLLAQNTGLDGQMDLSGALLSAQTDPKQAYQANTVTTLAGLIQQQNAAKYKAQQDAIKFKADTAKTDAETGKLSQEGVGKGLENTQKGQTSLANIIATSTSPSDALTKVATFGQQYGLSPEIINSANTMLSGYVTDTTNGTADFEKMRNSFGLLGAEKPIEYMQPNANTVASNETSIKTTGMNNDASKYVANSNAATAEAKLVQEDKQFKATQAFNEQKLRFENEKGQVTAGTDGKNYIFYPATGKYEPMINESGQHIGVGTKSPTDIRKESERLDKMESLLKQAEGLIPNSTHSGIGERMDTTASFFGRSPNGADNLAALKALQGSLVMMMPRMEGPQSDKDVQLYREMAGRLGEPIPVSQRLEAIKAIRDINEKYAEIQGIPKETKPNQQGIPYANTGQKAVTSAASKYGM